MNSAKHTHDTAQHQAGDGTLVAGQLYAIDGGIFRAKINEESGQYELWTYQGMAGPVVARTGFDIGADGQLMDRIYDVGAEAYCHPVPPRFTVADVEPMTEAELTSWTDMVESRRGDMPAADIDIWER